MALKEEKKILLVEDEPSLIAMYQAAFRSSSYELLVAADAATGLKLAQENNISLILLDVIIPEAEGKVIEFSKRVGFNLLGRLKKDPKTKSIPVITLTNLDSPEDRVKASSLGAVDYLIKANFLPKEVVETATKILNKK
ncbi:response regulator [Patescibacteria group bacterium]|nr:response regulator [Patescibacteria group bacterium]MBU1074711.1 response regulator [Patescibacteria group bacterium]MBU1952279.1 response regulator [Patescibacteria group bacterium]MBU2229246.1 response regulator [Patescibacteria group bacterium]MBU2235701.1 response regulator [Patescibacteria group bacterium]